MAKTISFSASAGNSGWKANATGSMPVAGFIKATGNASASGAWGKKPVVDTKVSYGLNL